MVGWGQLGDDAAIRGHLIEPDLSGISLCDRVRCEEAELAPLPQQRGSPQGEVGAQIGVATLSCSEVTDEIVSVVRPEATGDLADLP